jgi:TonB family protein
MKPFNLFRRIRFSEISTVFMIGMFFAATDAGGQIPSPQKNDQGNNIPLKYPVFFMTYGNDSIYGSAEKNPAFPGGNKSLEQYKLKKLKYPCKAKKAGFEGSVQINFIIEKDGTLSNIRIVTGVSPSLDAKALKVAKSIPKFQPGMEKGRPVKFAFSTPFTFVLDPEKPEEVRAMGQSLPTSMNPSKVDEETPFVVVEEMPQFPGGDTELLKFIAENTRYPENAKQNNIQGRVIIRFCVTKTGSIDKVSILKGVSYELDGEAVRVVSELPAFIPGRQGGKAVNVWYMVPITFALNQNKSSEINTPDFKDKSEALSKTTVAYKPPEYTVSGYDEAPVYKGRETAMKKFITRNIAYPPSARSKGILGKAIINYCISSNGKVEVATVYQGIDPELDAEALRVVKMLPDFKPARLQGKPVHVWYQIPVIFNHCSGKQMTVN